jgi:hypothetical protein
MSRAVAEIIKFIPFFGEKAALALNTAANAANVEANKLRESMGAGAKEVAAEMMKAGAAMPQEFEKNKDALDPLFNLTDEFAEQKALQQGISAELAKTRPVTEAIAVAGTEYADALKRAKESFQGSDLLSHSIALNLESAALSSERIDPAFSLSEDSSGEIAINLENAVPHAKQASEFLADGSQATSALDINGRSYAASAAAAANSVNSAKLDAEITAEAFTGMSERMQQGASAVNNSLNKMREAHHFGRKTMEEVYQGARNSGQNIIDASKSSADYMRAQERMSSDMRKAEEDMIRATKRRDLAYEKAQKQEMLGRERSAHRTRMNADEKFTREMEKVAPALERGVDFSRKMLEESGTNTAKSIDEGGKTSGAALEKGGEAAAKPMQSAADAIKEAGGGLSNTIATENTLLRVIDYLKSVDEKLPQHALI